MISRGTQRALAFAEDDVHRHLYLVINMKETFKCFRSLSTVIRLARWGGRLSVDEGGWTRSGRWWNKVRSKNISRDSLLLSHQFRAGLRTTWPSKGVRVSKQ